MRIQSPGTIRCINDATAKIYTTARRIKQLKIFIFYYFYLVEKNVFKEMLKQVSKEKD